MLIYSFLAKSGKANVSQLVGFVKLKQPTISYHLKEMEKSGILASEKSGKEVYYRISHVCPFDKEKCVLD